MQYVHVRSLKKYHPSYKDRRLSWAKIYFKMVQGDPDCEMITNEIDWGRLIKFIILELQAQSPIPLNEEYLIRKGFNLVNRPIDLTIKALHKFLDIVTEPLQNSDVEEEKEEEEEEEKEARYTRATFQKPSLNDLIQAFKTVGLETALATAEASKFLDYYETVGWVVGRTRKPMKSWRGALSTWMRNRAADSAGAAKPAKKPSPTCDAHDKNGMIYDGQGRKLPCWCVK